MDGIYTLPENARELGVSRQRVQRVAATMRMQFAATSAPKRSTTIVTEAQRRTLIQAIGTVPSGKPLARIQLQTLAALARAPRGVVSARALARRIGSSPTTMTKTVDDLESAGLLVRRAERIALGRVTDVDMLHVDRDSAAWQSTSPLVAQTRLPQVEAPQSRRASNELFDVFWKTHWNQLQLGGSAGYIARRLTSTDDLDALAWGANHLGEYAWTHAAGARGITPYDDASLKILPGRPPHDPGTAPKLPPA